jgi:outer membrane biosynthesis protein TonB
VSNPATRPPRTAAAACVLLLALALHALLLGLAPLGLGGGSDAGARPILQTRQIVLAPPAPAPPPPAPVAAAATPPAAPKPTPQPTPAREAAPPPEPPASAPPPDPVVEVMAQPAAEPASAAASEAAVASAPPGGEQVPTYATVLPPPATLVYDVKRGGLAADGELRWTVSGDAYRLSLEASAFGLSVLSWTSTGRVDANGLAPDRFTDRRRGRSELAANFQREAGRISYSGPTVTYPLVPGAQDRLSWMLQLPAILEASPTLREPGRRIMMFVTGARGDADVWTFVVQGRTALDLPGGPVPDAIHLLRAPRKAYDTQAEAWLDPARGHLLVRVRLTTPDTGDSTEFLLAR